MLTEFRTNLHDGAQQNLVALKVKVGLAELVAERDPAKVRTLILDSAHRYPAAVEAAVYYCLEALQNIQKYACATRAVVTIAGQGREITFSVADDRAGFDVAHAVGGSGLKNMADWVAAMGGALEVVSTPGGGTTVSGRLPAEPVGSA